MRKELTNKLYKAYPEIFKQHKLDMSRTAMCFGFQCGDGWYWLIDALCKRIQIHSKARKIKTEATTVKEKFGGLRFYVDGGDDSVEGMIDLAMELSYRICENCGTPEDVSINSKGYTQTLCSKCRSKEHK